MRVAKQCPECSEKFYGRSCKCGYAPENTISNLSPSDSKEQFYLHMRCWFETNGKRCQMLGTSSRGTGERGKDKWGATIRGPWYCTWHFKKIIFGNRNNDIQEFDKFQEFVESQKQSGVKSQFIQIRPSDAWKRINGVYGRVSD